MKSKSEFYEGCERALASTVPWWGAFMARRAVGALRDHTAEPEAVVLLLKAASHRDPRTRSGAEAALRSLKAPAAADALCGVWAKERDALLGRVIQECGYAASQPVRVRVLSHLQAGKALELRTAEEVAVAVDVLKESDKRLASGAEAALRSLKAPAAADALCALAVLHPKSAVVRVCVDQRYRPSDPEIAAVFLIATGQVDAYFAEHGDLRDLRAGYARADATVQTRLNAVAGAGDARLLPFLRQRRRTLRESSPEERDGAVRHSIERQDWVQVFEDCQQLPLQHSLAGWVALAEAGWVPSDEADAAMLEQIRGALRPNGSRRGPRIELGPAFTPPGTSALFEQWLEAGRRPELARLGESELLARLDTSDPPEGVSLVAALAFGGKASATARRRVAENRHWLIRLAGHITGLLADAGADPAKEPNHWVREIGGGGAVWRIWPEDATVDLLQAGGGPREAALAADGGPRAIFRVVLGRRLVSGDWQVRERPAGTDGGTFVPKTRKDSTGHEPDQDLYA